MTTFQKKLTIAFFITSLATASMAAERDEDQELKELQQQLVTLQIQNQEREEALKKESIKQQILQQIEEEKQRAITLNSSKLQVFQPVDPLKDFTSTLNNTALVGLSSLQKKLDGTENPEEPSTWVPVREELKQAGVNFLLGFLNQRTQK